MLRYFVILFLCVIFSGSNATFAVDTVDEIRTEIEKLTETPFPGTAQDYPDYVIELGNEILALVEPAMKRTELSDTDKKYFADAKLLGSRLRYIFNDKQYEKKYEEYLEEIHDYALYRKWITRTFNDTFLPFLYADKTEQRKIFVPLVDRLAPRINKYFNDEKRDSGEPLPTMILQYAEIIDPDGSSGVVRSTFEKLKPIFQSDLEHPERVLNFCARRALNSTRRLDMVGKPIDLALFDLDNQPINLDAMKGKVVLLVQAPYRRNDEKLIFLEKLDNALQEEGIEILLFLPSVYLESIGPEFKNKSGPWVVGTYHAKCNAEGWFDYAERFGTHDFSFIIDREGIVRSARGADHRITPEFYEALKPLFPNRIEEITQIAEEVRTVEKRIQKEYHKKQKNAQKTGNENLPGPLRDLVRIRTKISTLAPPEMLLVLIDLILADDKLTPKMRSNTLRMKVNILDDLAKKTIKRHPETRPEIAFEKMNALIDELLKTDDADLRSYFFNVKQRALFHSCEYLKTLKSGQQEYADEITQRFLDITKQVPLKFYCSSNSFFLSFYDILEEIDTNQSSQLTKAFIKQVVPVFEEKESPEYRQEAKFLKNVLRRLELSATEMEFETVLMDGSKINVKDLRGKVVVINFWNTGCLPCRNEFPHMKKMYEKYKPHGYEMIAYSNLDEAEELKAFAAKYDYPWLLGSMRMSLDAGLTDYADFYGVVLLPTTMILDRSGKVRFMMVGANDELFARELEKRFAEEP